MNFTTEETTDATLSEIVEIGVSVEDEEYVVSTEETVATVEVETTEEIEIEIEEAIGWVGGDNRYHDSLLGTDSANQHPITAIGGLRHELDEIEALKTVYSNKIGVANYYKWHDAAYDETGYFVSIVPDTDTIQICNETDILGVTIDDAAFIGGQDGVTLDYVYGATETHGAARDNSYGLVATSGLVDVRCELDVNVGDCVVANAYGYAKRATSNYGYKVLAKENKRGIEYAVILLGVQADITDTMGKDLMVAGKRLDAAEVNIAAAMNVANDAYNKADECLKSNQDMSNQLNGALGVVDGVSSDMNDLKDNMANSALISAQAKAIAESAATSAESMKNEAVGKANEALDKAGEIEKTVEPINSWTYTDPVTGETNTGATYFAEYVKNGLSTKAEVETVVKLDEENKLLIEKNAENYTQMLSSIDKYSVGGYSQAHGLTLEQARNILNLGMIYIPIAHGDANTHSEKYENGDDEPLEREFTYGYYYEWTTLEDGAAMWSEKLGKVWFGAEQPSGSVYIYWYNGKQLYLLEDGEWTEVATLAGNVNNRITSMIRQTANEVSAEVVNARGSSATLGARLTDTESEVQSLALWSKGGYEDGEQYNLATIKQTADNAGADIALVVQEKDGQKVINGASIVAAVNGAESGVTINADHVNLNGYVTVAGLSGGTTTIDGGCIKTGTLDASKVTVVNLDASKITTGTLDANKVTINGDLSAFGATIGGFTIGDSSIYSNNKTSYNSKISGIYLGTDGIALGEYFKVNNSGELTATEGQISGWHIGNTDISKVVQDPENANISYRAIMRADSDNVGSAFAIAVDTKTIDTGGTEKTTTNWPFHVSYKGVLTAAQANINGSGTFKGQITASDGEIGGLSLSGSTISSSGGELMFSNSGVISVKQLQADVVQVEGLQVDKISGQGDSAYLDFKGTDNKTRNITIKFSINITDEGSPGFLGLGWNAGSMTITATAHDSSGVCELVGVKTVNVKLTYGKYGYGAQTVKTVPITIHTGSSTGSSTVVYRVGPDDDYCVTTTIPDQTYTEYIGQTNKAIISNGSLLPQSDGSVNLGSTKKQWDNIYVKTSYFLDGGIFTSDTNKKNNISPINDKYSMLFDMLRPVTFKFNDGTSDRTHIGLIAQEVKDSMDACGIDSKDCAAYCSWDDEDGNETCGLRYGEFIPLNTLQIQKLKPRVSMLEEKVQMLEEQNAQLREQITALLNQN